jgi:Flp pilus assembly protein TadD
MERLDVHVRMITRWIAMTKASHPRLSRRLKGRLGRAQSALANHYLFREDFQTAQSILARAARGSRRPTIVAKYVWSKVAPRSLRRDIIRRHYS